MFISYFFFTVPSFFKKRFYYYHQFNIVNGNHIFDFERGIRAQRINRIYTVDKKKINHPIQEF